MPPHREARRSIWAWALYDWANSAFATTVLAGFFPVFFKEYWSAHVPATQSTLQLGAANSLGSLLIVLAAPVLGAIADAGGARKRFLFVFAAAGVAATAALYWVPAGAWVPALVLFVVAGGGFAAGNIFYDSLLVDVVEPARFDRVSALGFALGYLGGGLLFAVNVAMTLWPAAFGLADASQAVRVSFLSVALWWTVFSVPLFVRVHEHGPAAHPGAAAAVRGGFGRLRATFAHVRGLRQVVLFLLAYWLYIDGVDTIVRMAVDYGLSLGFPTQSLIAALLLTQFVGFPAALAFGRLGERWGTRRGILLGIAVYAGITLWATRMQAVWEFYTLAAIIGLVQGGVQALSRSLYARLIPADQSAEFFGFYNMLGKFAAVLGPVLVGVTAVWTGSARLSLLAIIVLFVAGGLLLLRVDEADGARAARALELGRGRV